MPTFDPTTLLTAAIVFALTAAAKAAGLPDATAVARAFAAAVALLIPIIIAWRSGHLAAVDWGANMPALLEAGKILLDAALAYLAATGIHAHAKEVTPGP